MHCPFATVLLHQFNQTAEAIQQLYQIHLV